MRLKNQIVRSATADVHMRNKTGALHAETIETYAALAEGGGSMNYALYESLCMVEEEDLENRWARHRDNVELLWRGLQDLGLEPIVRIDHRLPSLITVRIPEGVDEKAVRSELLSDYNIEIAGGLGIFAGVAWRIGCMGDSSRRENVTLLLGALRQILNR